MATPTPLTIADIVAIKTGDSIDVVLEPFHERVTYTARGPFIGETESDGLTRFELLVDLRDLDQSVCVPDATLENIKRMPWQKFSPSTKVGLRGWPVIRWGGPPMRARNSIILARLDPSNPEPRCNRPQSKLLLLSELSEGSCTKYIVFEEPAAGVSEGPVTVDTRLLYSLFRGRV